ncbi:flagellar regulatory protein FliZ [Lonsdalea iberica]|uniref:Flagellar regulatory protein FliZ n=1 Tax=Lonsdalea iberica TaxID=1082703 RepID=A0ABX3XDA8_9GAMM|nr:flagella biosynthesis regulatory protein FliZ [Lonsdalea iberica]OSN08132.1 flagellar regulatory protein FliZ [Lonsdalea iberica]
MSQSARKKLLLSRYLKDFKHKQTHCSNCGKSLDRVSLVYQSKPLNKKALEYLDRKIDDETWESMREELIPLCRFCSEVFCKPPAHYFNIKSFTRYLIDQTEVQYSTMREYVIRLRRLDELLITRHYPSERLAENESIQQQICSDIPNLEQNTYRSALRKYDQFLDWEKNFSRETALML